MHKYGTSPIGLYLASYLVVFAEMNDGEDDDPKSKFMVCEDTIIVKGESLEDAYHKVLSEVKRSDFAEGDAGAISMSWLCEGVTEFLPIYEVFTQGCEIMYRENNSTKLKYLPFPVACSEQSGNYPH